MQDDATFESNRHAIDGLQFCATLRIRTPLAVLQHHGEEFSGPPSAAPKYGSTADGIWTYTTKSWAELGIDAPEFPELSQAADIGPMIASEYLPFLLAFREIVETDMPHDAKISRLEVLGQSSESFRRIYAKLQSSYEDFPLSFFYSPFAELPGVGRKMAKKLYEAGFRSVDEITRSNMDRLSQIPGMGPSTIKKLLALASKESAPNQPLQPTPDGAAERRR